MQAAGRTTLTKRGSLQVGLLAVGLWLLGLAIDQVTKIAALSYLVEGESIEVLGRWLRLTLIFNPGAAFGMGASGTIFFSIFAVIATLACLFVMLPRVRRAWHGVALGLMLAGITGNLVDRMFQPPSFMRGHVIDFLQVPNFAIFNFADMCITVGAALIVIGSFFWDDTDKASRAQGTPDEVPAP